MLQKSQKTSPLMGTQGELIQKQLLPSQGDAWLGTSHPFVVDPHCDSHFVISTISHDNHFWVISNYSFLQFENCPQTHQHWASELHGEFLHRGTMVPTYTVKQHLYARHFVDTVLSVGLFLHLFFTNSEFYVFCCYFQYNIGLCKLCKEE